jgi:hypothetical protein
MVIFKGPCWSGVSRQTDRPKLLTDHFVLSSEDRAEQTKVANQGVLCSSATKTGCFALVILVTKWRKRKIGWGVERKPNAWRTSLAGIEMQVIDFEQTNGRHQRLTETSRQKNPWALISRDPCKPGTPRVTFPSVTKLSSYSDSNTNWIRQTRTK